MVELLLQLSGSVQVCFSKKKKEQLLEVEKKTSEAGLRQLEPITDTAPTPARSRRGVIPGMSVRQLEGTLEKMAVKGKKLIILLKDVQASLLTRWLHLLSHQREC